MKKWVLLALFAVFFLAVFIRLLPLTQYGIWGSDTGEYYRITSELTSEGHVSTDYDGWGFAYPYFPGMFYVSGSVHLLTDIDNLWAVLVVIPVLACLSTLIVFFIAKLLFKSDGAALFAGAFIAVAMPHVFPTSHPMPGSMGDVLFLFSLLLLLLSFENKKFFPLLILTAVALVITHPLSVYFLLVAVLGGLFLEEMVRNEDKKDTKFHWAFMVFLLTIIILYWSIYATPFADRVVTMAFDLPFLMVLAFGYLALLLVFILIRIRRRFDWNYQPKFPELKTRLAWFFIMLCVLISVLVFMALIRVPGTNLGLTPNVALLFTPLIVLLAFTSVGSGYLKFYDRGLMVYGWIVAMVLSLILGIVTSNRVLLTYRHPQYLMPPLALAVGLGMVFIFNALNNDRAKLKKGLVIGIIVVLLGLTALSAYPSKEVMGGFQEGTSPEDMDGVFWAKYSLNEWATVASDHRMSSMLFGFAELNATWDSARKTIHSSSYNESKDEIEKVDTPSGDKPIDYILLDDEIKEGAALLQWENAEPMSLEAQEKFEKWPFIKLYEANGVEVYGMVK